MTSANQIEVKEITINIETPDGKLPPAKVRIPNVPMRLANLVPPMQQLCSGVVGLTVKREIALGSTISCHKGCGVCCCQLVPLSAPEAFFLYDYVNLLPYKQRCEIMSRFSAIKDAMKSVGLIEKLEKLEDTSEHKALAFDYFKLGMPCPFLEDESCSIHSIRPLACREYNVISSPELCIDPFNNDILRIKVPRNMTTATAMLAAEVCGVPPALIPMTLALEWAVENENVGHLTWPGIWLFERMLEHATGSNVDEKESEINHELH
jgi:Fe-S-cluster containining protein